MSFGGAPSFSRKAYHEVVYHQTTEKSLRFLENAFWPNYGKNDSDSLLSCASQVVCYGEGDQK